MAARCGLSHIEGHKVTPCVTSTPYGRSSCSRPLTPCHRFKPRVLRAEPSDKPDAVVDNLIESASKALTKAREALADVQRAEEFLASTSAPTFIPTTLTFGAPLSGQNESNTGSDGNGGSSRPQGSAGTAHLGPSQPVRPVPVQKDGPISSSRASATAVATESLPTPSPSMASDSSTSSAAPSSSPPPRPTATLQQGEQQQPWGEETESHDAPTMILQRQRVRSRRKDQTDFAEPNSVQEMSFPRQPETKAQKKMKKMKSVKQLTFAHVPPAKAGEAAPAEAAEGAGESEVAVRGESEAGHMLPDGKGVLPDGSTYERISGEETGDNGYWCRWWVMRGTAMSGRVEWEETWWESSDWSGMREMGAQKVGCNVSGDAWREAWKERVYHVADTGEPCVERSAHKWAKDEVTGEQWEEKWGEFYAATGNINKWAEKWGKRGADVWHEKWGEDYEKGGDACLKWTDRWSETMLDGGAQRSQGDKWREEFSGGTGRKNGETWYVDESGHRYQRTWGENHFGEGWVQKYGHSTAGEHWDATEQTGTYYNPSPHFTFQMALDHSPDLLDIPVRPREATVDDFTAGGMDNF